MLVKQEIQAIQDDNYRFVVNHKRTDLVVTCYEKDLESGFFKHMGDVLVINKNGRKFRTADCFKLIKSKSIKTRLLSVACKYLDERRVS